MNERTAGFLLLVLAALTIIPEKDMTAALFLLPIAIAAMTSRKRGTK